MGTHTEEEILEMGKKAYNQRMHQQLSLRARSRATTRRFMAGRPLITGNKVYEL